MRRAMKLLHAEGFRIRKEFRSDMLPVVAPKPHARVRGGGREDIGRPVTKEYRARLKNVRDAALRRWRCRVEMRVGAWASLCGV